MLHRAKADKRLGLSRCHLATRRQKQSAKRRHPWARHDDYPDTVIPLPINQFGPAIAKLWIASIDDPKIEVRAQYNPKELQIDKQVPWSNAKERDNQQGAQRADKSTQTDLEFNGATKRSMQIELLFDGFEIGESVEPDIQTLEILSTVQNPQSSNEDERRPHHCLVAWGAPRGGIRPFCCVIESLTTKYTMWDTNGVPLRATCTVKLKEAERMTKEPRSLPPYGVKDRANPYLDEREGRRDR